MADILILANSTKKRGYCVAGKEIASNKWIRLVANSMGAELGLNQTTYNDLANRRQTIPYEPLNKVLRLNLGNAVPLLYQPENVLVNQNLGQEIKVTQPSITYDTPSDLWGVGDRIKASDIEQGLVKITQSLYLIQVSNMQFYTNNYNKNRAYFQYENNTYDLGTTINPSIFNNLKNGLLSHNNIITISLGEPFLNPRSNQREHYKLVAAVF
jgi:hypothetical protein